MEPLEIDPGQYKLLDGLRFKINTEKGGYKILGDPRGMIALIDCCRSIGLELFIRTDEYCTQIIRNLGREDLIQEPSYMNGRRVDIYIRIFQYTGVVGTGPFIAHLTCWDKKIRVKVDTSTGHPRVTLFYTQINEAGASSFSPESRTAVTRVLFRKRLGLILP